MLYYFIFKELPKIFSYCYIDILTIKGMFLRYNIMFSLFFKYFGWLLLFLYPHSNNKGTLRILYMYVCILIIYFSVKTMSLDIFEQTTTSRHAFRRVQDVVCIDFGSLIYNNQ